MTWQLRYWLMLTGGISCLLTSNSNAQEKPAVLAYRVTIDGNIKITTDNAGSTSRRTIAEVDYRLAKTKDGIDVGVDRFGFRAMVGNQEVDQVELTRTRITSRPRSLDLSRSGAGPGVLPLFEQFDPPLLSVKLDAEGAETGRKAKEELGPLIGSRVVDLTRLFHVKFPKNETKWEAPVVIPFGRNQHANGILRYAKKAEPNKDGTITVDVTGFLKVEGAHDVAQIKRGEYKVGGVQIYDPNINDWVSGKLTVAVGWDAELPNGLTIHGAGPATYSLSRRDATSKNAKSARKK